MQTEQRTLEHLLNSPHALREQVKTELERDAKVYGDERCSPLIARNAAQAFETTALIANEPLTIILSQKGWIRAAKGHEIDVQSLNFRSGDGLLTAVKGRSTQPIYLLDSTGRSYSTASHDLPSARTHGEPLTGRLNPPDGATFNYLLTGNPEDWYILASSIGYGFRVQLGELASKNKAGKAMVTLSDNASLLKPLFTEQETDLLAVATLQGRLLIFPILELPILNKGKGNKLIQIPHEMLEEGKDAVIAMTILSEQSSLKIVAGKRILTLRESDIKQYTSNRAKRGLGLPRGFQRVDELIAE